jgi:hypothetical protein
VSVPVDAALADADAVPVAPAVVAMLTVALPPLGSAPSVQVTVEPPVVQVPCGVVAPVTVAPVTPIVTVALVKSSGP